MKRFEGVALVATLVAVAVLTASLVLGLGAEPTGRAAGAWIETPDAPPEPSERIRIEVLNAAGIPGLARAATGVLRERGFDVVYFGNAASLGGDSSWVIDRVGRPEAARRVADALEIAQVRLDPDSSLYLEVTVVLGRDWQGGAARAPLPYRAATGEP